MKQMLDLNKKSSKTTNVIQPIDSRETYFSNFKFLCYTSYLKNKVPINFGGKNWIPLNSVDNEFIYEYFMSLSDKITNKCCPVRQNLGVSFNCPLSGAVRGLGGYRERVQEGRYIRPHHAS